MIDQVLISKRIFSIGKSYSRQSDPLSAGLAISFFQDAIEQLVWCIAKDKDINVKEFEAFISLLNKIEKYSEDPLPHKAKILELNKARVGFKHYGNLPAESESKKFCSYAYDFLIVASKRYLGIDFEQVSLASLITDKKVRGHIEAAERHLAEEEIEKAISEAAIARFFLFKRLNQYLPKIAYDISNADTLFNQIPEIRWAGVQVFSHLAQYLDEVARFNAAALAGGDVGEHLYFERSLPHVLHMQSGKIRISYIDSSRATSKLAEKAITYVVKTAIRLEGA